MLKRVALAARLANQCSHLRRLTRGAPYPDRADARIERHRERRHALARLVRMASAAEAAARQRADFRAAEALEQRHAPLRIGPHGSFGADQDKLRGVSRMAVA
jgi:hypothetical protein